MARVAEIEFHPSAVAEFDAAFDWYRGNSEQAAADFLRELNDAIASIAANPVRWAEHLHGSRR